MSAATASAADVSRTDVSIRGDHRSNSGQSQAQCAPIPLSGLGTQKIIQGNGTNVGTVISLQCPAKHKLVGALTCVMVNNSPHWEGETFCEPSYEDFGFHVAVLASIVSTAIILLMSMAFITCCLLDSINEDKRKKQEREGDVWQWEERAQREEDHRSHYSHKGRNNNNNNTQEKMLFLWDTHNLAICDDTQGCRCYQQYANGFVHTYEPNAPLAALPGHGYDPPLLPRNPEYAQISGPPQYPGPGPGQTRSPGLVQNSAAGPGLDWQYGRQQSSLSGANASTAEDGNTRNINTAKEFSIRIISV